MTKKLFTFWIPLSLVIAVLMWSLFSIGEALVGDGGRESCFVNLSHIYNGLDRHDREHGHLPPVFHSDDNSKPLYSWRVAMLPHLGRGDLMSEIQPNLPWNDEAHSVLRNTRIRNFHCRYDPGTQTDTSYVAIVGDNTLFPTKNTKTDNLATRKLSEGASNTILVAEVANSSINWMEPRDISLEDASLPINSKKGQSISSTHPPATSKARGACTLFADGRFVFLNEKTDPKILRTLLEIDSPDKPKEKYISP
ncbi:MAG: DUF1559 domain-containing protein [Planctomycetaceae bacterium]|nr:DUF1559 domain-containing protein [Planctomycetaceae bacterium]